MTLPPPMAGWSAASKYQKTADPHTGFSHCSSHSLAETLKSTPEGKGGWGVWSIAVLRGRSGFLWTVNSLHWSVDEETVSTGLTHLPELGHPSDKARTAAQSF